MAEIAVVSCRKSKLESDAKKGNSAARKVLKVAEKPEAFLSTIQIGITLIGILTGLYSGDAFAGDLAVVLSQWSWLEPYALGVSQTLIVIAVTYFTLVFGELFPKSLGMSASDKIAKVMVGPMDILSKIVMPFVWLLSASTNLLKRIFRVKESDDSKVTEEEIKAMVQEGTEDGEIEEVEQDIVERVFTLNDRSVESIMTHRSELVWLDVNDSNTVLWETINEKLFNVYPVCDGELDELLGVVYLKDLFGHIGKTDFNIRSMVRPAIYLPENQGVFAALEQMKQEFAKYGLVIDEFGAIQGIVTMKDIMIALLGTMPDENQELDITERENGGWLVDGQCSFYDFLAHFDQEDLYAKYNYNTVSGLILEYLEHIPKAGETFDWGPFNFEIVDMDGARIDKILVQQRPSE